MNEAPASYGPVPSSDFEAQFRRVFIAASCRTQVELAGILNVRQSSVSDAKRRKSVPSHWLVALFERKRVNPDWIRTGQGTMLLMDDKRAGSALTAYSTDQLLAELLHRALVVP